MNGSKNFSPTGSEHGSQADRSLDRDRIEALRKGYLGLMESYDRICGEQRGWTDWSELAVRLADLRAAGIYAFGPQSYPSGIASGWVDGPPREEVESMIGRLGELAATLQAFWGSVTKLYSPQELEPPAVLDVIRSVEPLLRRFLDATPMWHLRHGSVSDEVVSIPPEMDLGRMVESALAEPGGRRPVMVYDALPDLLRRADVKEAVAHGLAFQSGWLRWDDLHEDDKGQFRKRADSLLLSAAPAAPEAPPASSYDPGGRTGRTARLLAQVPDGSFFIVAHPRLIMHCRAVLRQQGRDPSKVHFLTADQANMVWLQGISNPVFVDHDCPLDETGREMVRLANLRSWQAKRAASAPPRPIPEDFSERFTDLMTSGFPPQMASSIAAGGGDRASGKTYRLIQALPDGSIFVVKDAGMIAHCLTILKLQKRDLGALEFVVADNSLLLKLSGARKDQAIGVDHDVGGDLTGFSEP